MFLGGDEEGGPEESCRWCGCAKQDHQHLFWKCQRFEDVRSSVWGPGKVPDCDLLPRGLARCGLVPDLVLPRGRGGGE
eukprot:11552196-Alexandrium_andersonii.AAC.1